MSIFQKTLIIFLFGVSVNAQVKWVTPASQTHKENPFTNSQEAITNGQKTYASLCVACHGKIGRGDGVAAAGLNPKPADFTTKEFQNQSDAAIFWKLSTGRGVMAGYEGMLSEKERWEVVSYLKSLETTTTLEVKKKGEIKDDKINNTFLFTQLINAQTVQVLPKKSSEFTIQHRFGATSLNSEFIDQFLGMDLSSNIRFAYAMAVSDRMYVEIGRTKYGKVYDANIKYLLLQQTKDNKMPFSLALFGDLGIMTDKFPNIVEGSTFYDGSNFEYQFAHRLTYDFEFILAKKISEKLSLQLNSVFIWRNLAPKDENNLVITFPIGGCLKLNRKSALLFECSPVVNYTTSSIPISLAYEIASSSAHVFQFVLTSTDRILESNIYTHSSYDYSSGKFVLGFTIKRIF